MRMKLVFVASAAAVLAVAGLALAQDDVIAQRKALMKSNGQSAGTVFRMAGGKDPFDADAAIAALQKIQENMVTFPTLFPEGSDQGDTHALPAIWENMDDFMMIAAKLVTDAKAAEDAVAADGLDGLKATLGAVGGNCQNCHETYRAQI